MNGTRRGLSGVGHSDVIIKTRICPPNLSAATAPLTRALVADIRDAAFRRRRPSTIRARSSGAFRRVMLPVVEMLRGGIRRG